MNAHQDGGRKPAADPTEQQLLTDLWRAVGDATAPVPGVTFEGPQGCLPSVFEVSRFATACVGVAVAAASELEAARAGRAAGAVRVDRGHAAAAFCSERYCQPLETDLPGPWDGLAGDYRTADGFIRLHTNYAHHRRAALRALGVGEDREDVKRVVLGWSGESLEQAVVDAGGCAAAMRTRDAWLGHPQGRAVAAAPLCTRRTWEAAPSARLLGDLGDSRHVARPLSGVRVLDLTRVLAGPVCTRLLAGYGADVLRIDPPSFEEVPAVVPDVTPGKRCAQLDLRSAEGRATLDGLLAQADVLVHGYRPGALTGLGYDDARLRELQPGLITVQVTAYGHEGPWGGRRGFDSLVQMSCGIAARGARVAGSERPHPLPAQALDHGTGYLMAAAALRSLTRLLRDDVACAAQLSLASTAECLVSLGDRGDPSLPGLSADAAQAYLEIADSRFGRLKRVACPGRIDGKPGSWSRPAGPLGRDPATWGA